jgi:hypothetical protein|tara:strand:+ start:484 stop:633 length:150 start_codon:yes stop_codon:yes gene_type:complete
MPTSNPTISKKFKYLKPRNQEGVHVETTLTGKLEQKRIGIMSGQQKLFY